MMVSYEYIIVSVCCPSHTGARSRRRKELAQHNHTLYQILTSHYYTVIIDCVNNYDIISAPIHYMLSAVAMLPRGVDQLSFREVV